MEFKTNLTKQYVYLMNVLLKDHPKVLKHNIFCAILERSTDPKFTLQQPEGAAGSEACFSAFSGINSAR